MSGAHARRKGLVGEREVAHIFRDGGFDVRGLEGLGDHIATKPNSDGLIALHLEIKRQERLAVPEWLRQCADETPAGMTPVVCFRQNGTKWIAALPLDDLIELLR